MNTATPAPIPHPPGAGARAAAPAVLLLHASASSQRQWQSLRDALGATWHVLTLDFHGHGERAAWRGPGAQRLADDVALAAERLAAVGGGHVVGHSYGGAVALKLAQQHPALVHGLVCHEPVLLRLLRDAAPTAEPVRQAFATAEHVRACLQHDDAEAAATCFVDFWSGAGTWLRLPAAQRDAIRSRMPAVMSQYDGLLHESLSAAELARLRLPMLMLGGSQSVPAARCIAALLRRVLPQARHEALPGVDHMGPLTAPETFNRCVLRFLDAGTPPRSLPVRASLCAV